MHVSPHSSEIDKTFIVRIPMEPNVNWMLLDHNGEDIKILRDLGLTLSQAKVYFVAANLGNAKAKDLREGSGIGRQELYRILDELLEIGLIERQISSPALFRSTPLSKGTLILLERKQAETLALGIEAQKLLSKNGEMK